MPHRTATGPGAETAARLLLHGPIPRPPRSAPHRAEGRAAGRQEIERETVAKPGRSVQIARMRDAVRTAPPHLTPAGPPAASPSRRAAVPARPGGRTAPGRHGPPPAPPRRYGCGIGLVRLAALMLAVCLLVLPARPALAELRVALVIGNADYAHVPPLENPVNDARDVAAALESLNFRVFLGEDLSGAEMRTLFDRFVETATEADVTLLFFAGHGLQAGTRNYLVPTDATLESVETFLQQAIALDELLTDMERTSGIRLIFLDACRDRKSVV